MNSLAEAEGAARPARHPQLALLLLFASLGFLWFFLCRQLSYEWAANEQYSYGWFVPFFAAFLFWLRLEEKVESSRNAGEDEAGFSNEKVENENPFQSHFLLLTLAFLLLAALLPIRLFEVANPDWRPLSWGHALTVVGLSLLVIGYLGGKPAVKHFAFPVCFILVAVPWVSPIEAPIVQGLMRLVASIATETLTLFGIPAQLEGSLIRGNNGVVGVSEACSGVRSLQTSLMIGLLFGELKRLSLGRRVVLVAAALAIAFLANCGRAFFLVWIAATQNLAAVERWHDLAGYGIVGAVFLGTIATAAWLAKWQRSEIGGQRAEDGGQRGFFPAFSLFSFRISVFSVSAFLWLLFVEASVSAWYRWHERTFVRTTSWTVNWPESAAGFRALPIDDNVRSTLRYDAGREGTWKIALTTSPDETAMPANWTMFFFRWKPGSASILRARAHRPDICLPNTGWRVAADDGVRSYAIAPDFKLPFRHFRFVRDIGDGRQVFAQAFFCQREDRVPPGAPDRFDATSGRTNSWMRDDRVRVVREGLRNQGQQVLELVLMTPNEITSDTGEREFGKMVRHLVTSGR